MSTRWERVKELFAQATDLEGEEREAYLEQACGDDDALLREVRALLATDRRDHSLLDEGAGGALGEQAFLAIASKDPDAIGRAIGPYTLLERLGEGGMGEVWLAEQSEPVRRRVALKVIKQGMDTRQVVARFEAEKQALAQMEHPAIAKVYDAGATPRGRPYFVMEYVPGSTITEHCDANRLSNRGRLELFRQVCAGVQHAHQKAVIHRDLKPSNVMVATFDGRPAPKIIDFGVAKATAGNPADYSVQTQLGAAIGTPAYMSPEQADPTGRDVDTRTDVYALGVMLYELLVGALPFDSKDPGQVGFEGILRRIRDEEPPRPSMRLSTLGESSKESARKRRTELPALKRELAGDLDWITLKAMEKDPTRRYASPRDLAADIERYLADQPVLARPPSKVYRVGKFVRRHRLGVAAATVAALLLCGFVVALAVQSRKIARARDQAEQIAEFQAQQLSRIDAASMGARLRRSLLDDRERAFGLEGDAPPRSRETILAQLDESLGPINFTNIARQALEENVFRGAVTAIDTRFTDQPLLRARLLQTVTDSQIELGLHEAAESTQRVVVELRRELLGNDHRDTLASIHALALILGDLGRKDEAGKLYREALDGRIRALGPDDPDSIESMREHWLFVEDQEKLRLAEEALERSERVFGATHELTLEAQMVLADALARLGRTEAAEARSSSAYQTAERVYGPDHPVTGSALHRLAGSRLWSSVEHDDTERLLREALEFARRRYGDSHLRTIGAMQNLALFLEREARLDESEELLQLTLQNSLESFGPNAEVALLTLQNLGFVRYLQGDLQQAESDFRDFVDRRTRMFGPDDGGATYISCNLAMVLSEAGKPAEAEGIARDATARAARVLGAEHWVAGYCRGQLGLALMTAGRGTEARSELLEARRVLLLKFAEDNERVRRVDEYLGRL